jgi:hypothetical protein
MALVTVHNITDRPNTPGKPQAYLVGGRKVRPGHSTQVDRSALNGKFFAQLVAKGRLWVGALPPRFTRTSQAGLDARDRTFSRELDPPMDLREARAYLEERTMGELLELGKHMSPPFLASTTVSRPALLARLSRAIFQATRQLDPEVFFWLRRWTKNRHGDFVER